MITNNFVYWIYMVSKSILILAMILTSQRKLKTPKRGIYTIRFAGENQILWIWAYLENLHNDFAAQEQTC